MRYLRFIALLIDYLEKSIQKLIIYLVWVVFF